MVVKNESLSIRLGLAGASMKVGKNSGELPKPGELRLAFDARWDLYSEEEKAPEPRAVMAWFAKYSGKQLRCTLEFEDQRGWTGHLYLVSATLKPGGELPDLRLVLVAVLSDTDEASDTEELVALIERAVRARTLGVDVEIVAVAREPAQEPAA